MSNFSYIFDEVENIKNMYETYDPQTIIVQEGIILNFNNYFKELKGYYTVCNGFRYITVNNSLTESEKRIIMAHELGHDALHRTIAVDFSIAETMNFNNLSRIECEANEFAANLLISDKTILDWYAGELFEDELDEIFVYPDYFIAYKINDMRRRGYDIPEFSF